MRSMTYTALVPDRNIEQSHINTRPTRQIVPKPNIDPSVIDFGRLTLFRIKIFIHDVTDTLYF